ncbi:MAG: DUF1217 domain-containing protein [Rhodomicrobium sp.]|nr:DUF1217 domain-containing protein [Rhodomicrobium sp.]
MLTATASYRLISGNLTRSLQTASERPDVARQTEYYLKKIGTVKSIDAFLADERLFRYAMKAHGLEDMSYAKAFMRKVLEEGTDDPESFANTLTDSRYREFAETFNFQRYGETAIVFERAQQGTVDKYYRQSLEEEAGAQDEGVRLALYFERKAPDVETVYELLADRALLRVTQSLVGLSEAAGALDIDKQAALITRRLDIEDLKDPEKLQRLITRFTSLWEAQRQPDLGSSNAILIGAQLSFGISGDLLASIQNLRLGGS